jgi:predicted TIM-barrel fold metal-dependent hydrolase
MKIIDTHVHLGDIYGTNPDFSIENRTKETTHPGKPNLYERLVFTNIYFGKLNYLFKPLIASSARSIAKYGNLPNLLDSMKEAGIEKSIVLALEPYVSTESILKVCRQNDKFIPFCSVHPRDKEKNYKLRKYIGEGCRGLKIHPVIQKIAPDDPSTLELLEEVKTYNVPVLMHTGWGSIGNGGYGFTKHYKKILDAFPKMTFILAHMGFYEPLPLLDMVENRPNVYVDTSWQPAGIIRKAIAKIGEDRILLGSDWPNTLQSTSLNIVLKVTDNNPAVRDKILYKNAEKIIRFNTF